MTVWHLAPDNFTPPSRTPWGGQRIKQLKAGLALAADKAAYRCVGESWEVSTDAQFPSGIVGREQTLRELAPELPFLVKIIDTAEPLSVQVHPAHDFSGLKAGECGKPEAWFIYDAEPDAGVYIGFRDGVTKRDVQACIAASGPLNELMNFVPVKRDDVFEIAAGVPHAIGAGITLVEVQEIVPGKSGVTYRFWDWNRRYDGKPRPLHVEESLAVFTLVSPPRPEARPVCGHGFSAARANDDVRIERGAIVCLAGELEQIRAGAAVFVTEPVRLHGAHWSVAIDWTA